MNFNNGPLVFAENNIGKNWVTYAYEFFSEKNAFSWMLISLEGIQKLRKQEGGVSQMSTLVNEF